MLGKLFKYEFKNTSKLMLAIYGVTAGITVIGSVFLSVDAVQHGVLQIIRGILLTAYVISLIGLIMTTFIYMCYNFYKSMYTDQGYLTHTLPVSPLMTFHVKLVTSVFWMFCSVLLLACSIFLLLTGASKGRLLQDLNDLDLNVISAEFHTAIGMSLGQLIALILFIALAACTSYLLLVFASASIGQLFNQNKIVAAIIAGIGFYFLGQIINLVMMLIVASFHSSDLIAMSGSDISNAEDLAVLSPVISGAFVSMFLLISIYYITCNIIVRKHINLD